MFSVEHNIPFLVADYLMDLIKPFDPNSPELKKISDDRTKVVKLITVIIGDHSFSELLNHLKSNHFYIMIDESTDIGNTKNLVIIVCYLHENEVVDDFLALLEVKLNYLKWTSVLQTLNTWF